MSWMPVARNPEIAPLHYHGSASHLRSVFLRPAPGRLCVTPICRFGEPIVRALGPTLQAKTDFASCFTNFARKPTLVLRAFAVVRKTRRRISPCCADLGLIDAHRVGDPWLRFAGRDVNSVQV